MTFMRSVKEHVGVNRQIYNSLMENETLQETFGLNDTKTKRKIEEFLAVAGFEPRKDLAILISKNVLSQHGKSKAFSPILSKVLAIETGIQTYEPTLRDHIAHSVYVFLLGLLFISERNWDFFDPLSWKIASLLHDIGNPLELLSFSSERYLQLIREYKIEVSGYDVSYDYHVILEGLENLKFANDDAFTIIEDRLRMWGYCLDLRELYVSSARLNHGILSALIVLNLIDGLYAKHNPEKRPKKNIDGLDFGTVCYETQIVDAVAGISLHSVLDSIDTIIFEDSPLAFLLVLCDTLQEWDRFSPGQRVYDPFSINLEFCEERVLCRFSLSESKIHRIQHVINKKLRSESFEVLVVPSTM